LCRLRVAWLNQADRIDALKAEVARLRAALRPFCRFDRLTNNELARIAAGDLFDEACDSSTARLVIAARAALERR
jgi:hypothetical protein